MPDSPTTTTAVSLANAAVQRVADELEIRNLVARLAQLADFGPDLDEYIALFMPDAEWNMPGAPRRGHADIMAGAVDRRATGTVGPGSNTRHVITTLAVAVDGDSATSDCYFLFFVDTLGTRAVQIMGHYHDDHVRTAEGWKLARRTITFG
jgi:3-phenylpropionate/cinnamic acid dioxygenase small subunit